MDDPHLEQAGHSAGPLAEAPILEGPHPPAPPVVVGPFRWLLLRTGARTAWHQPILRILLLISVFWWFLINTFFVLEPLFVKATLRGGGTALLYLWSAHGAGALVGALAMTRVKRAIGREALLVNAGVATIGAGMLAYTGAGSTRSHSPARRSRARGSRCSSRRLALIQRIVSEDQRGRVTSVFVALQESMGLLSSIAVGVLAAVIAVRPTLIVASALLVVLGLVGVRGVVRMGGSERERAPAR